MMSFANLAEICGAPVAFPLKDGEALPLLLLDGEMGACPESLYYNVAGFPLWSAYLSRKIRRQSSAHTWLIWRLVQTS
jgi:hypothetical protein